MLAHNFTHLWPLHAVDLGRLAVEHHGLDGRDLAVLLPVGLLRVALVAPRSSSRERRASSSRGRCCRCCNGRNGRHGLGRLDRGLDRRRGHRVQRLGDHGRAREGELLSGDSESEKRESERTKRQRSTTRARGGGWEGIGTLVARAGCGCATGEQKTGAAHTVCECARFDESPAGRRRAAFIFERGDGPAARGGSASPKEKTDQKILRKTIQRAQTASN